MLKMVSMRPVAKGLILGKTTATQAYLIPSAKVIRVPVLVNDLKFPFYKKRPVIIYFNGCFRHARTFFEALSYYNSEVIFINKKTRPNGRVLFIKQLLQGSCRSLNNIFYIIGHQVEEIVACYSLYLVHTCLVLSPV